MRFDYAPPCVLASILESLCRTMGDDFRGAFTEWLEVHANSKQDPTERAILESYIHTLRGTEPPAPPSPPTFRVIDGGNAA